MGSKGSRTNVTATSVPHIHANHVRYLMRVKGSCINVTTTSGPTRIHANHVRYLRRVKGSRINVTTTSAPPLLHDNHTHHLVEEKDALNYPNTNVLPRRASHTSSLREMKDTHTNTSRNARVWLMGGRLDRWGSTDDRGYMARSHSQAQAAVLTKLSPNPDCMSWWWPTCVFTCGRRHTSTGDSWYLPSGGSVFAASQCVYGWATWLVV